MKIVLDKPLMSIQWRLKVVMAERDVAPSQLAELTGMHPTTISKLRNQRIDRYDRVTLNKLCQALNCQPGDLLRYVADDAVRAVTAPNSDKVSLLDAAIADHMSESGASFPSVGLSKIEELDGIRYVVLRSASAVIGVYRVDGLTLERLHASQWSDFERIK